MSGIFRCDATADIGFGHLSRCIALAEAFRLSTTDAIFVGLFDPAARAQIAAADFRSVCLAEGVNRGAADRETIVGALDHDPGSFIVVDSYQANEVYLADLKTLGAPTVVIDDFNALGAYTCDVVLNFTWEAPALDYPEGPVLLLGPQYFPARRQLVNLRPQSISRDRRDSVRNLLIAIGGSDPKRIADRLVRILAEEDLGICLRVVAADGADPVGELAGFLPGSRVLPRQPDLSEQLLWADACVTGGGLIKYESAFMGVPAAAVSQNEGQAGETRALKQAGLVFDLGLADERTDEELALEMNRFLSNTAPRANLISRIREVFSPDPTTQATRAILQAIGR